MAGRMVHVEIPADDTAAGRAFWGGLFGWKFEAVPMGDAPGEYHMAQFSDDQGGAVSSMEAGLRGLRPYFDVDDINAGVARVRELGGEASDAMPVPTMGWFSVCKDTQGSDFGLWQHDTSAAMPG